RVPGPSVALEARLRQRPCARDRPRGTRRGGHSPFNLGLAERAAGQAARATGGHADSEAHLARALDAFLSTDAAFEAGMTRLDLARALAFRGEAEGARAQLAAAVRALSATGAPRRVAEAHDLARSLDLGPVEPR